MHSLAGWNLIEKLFCILNCNINRIINWIKNKHLNLLHQIGIESFSELIKEAYMSNIPNLNFDTQSSLLLRSLEMTNLKEITGEGIKEIFEQILREEFDTMNASLKLEGKKLIKNGTYLKKIVFGNQTIEINCPRDRAGLFKPKCINRYIQATADTVETIILLLGSLSIRKITEFFQDRGLKISRAFVTKIYNQHAALLSKKYEAKIIPEEVDQIVVDGTYTKVCNFDVKNPYFPRRTKSVCILQAYGLKFDTKEKIDLGFKIVENESLDNYVSFFEELKSQGLNKFQVLTADNHPSIKKAAEIVYKDTFKFQKCFIHTKRNVMRLAAFIEKPIINQMFNQIRWSETKEEAQEIIWQASNKLKYKRTILLSSLSHCLDDLLTFQQFPFETRRFIYTSNMVESYNKVLKLVKKWKGLFHTEQSLFNSIIISKMVNKSIHRNIIF